MSPQGPISVKKVITKSWFPITFFSYNTYKNTLFFSTDILTYLMGYPPQELTLVLHIFYTLYSLTSPQLNRERKRKKDVVSLGKKLNVVNISWPITFFFAIIFLFWRRKKGNTKYNWWLKFIFFLSNSFRLSLKTINIYELEIRYYYIVVHIFFVSSEEKVNIDLDFDSFNADFFQTLFFPKKRLIFGQKISTVSDSFSIILCRKVDLKRSYYVLLCDHLRVSWCWAMICWLNFCLKRKFRE